MTNSANMWIEPVIEAEYENKPLPVPDEAMSVGYREIQAQWGLDSIAAVRLLASRAGWPIAHRSDSREPTRYMIPLPEWQGAKAAQRPPESDKKTGDTKTEEAMIGALVTVIDSLRDQLNCERSRTLQAEGLAAAAQEAMAEARRQLDQANADLGRMQMEQQTILRLGVMGRFAWAVRG